MNAGQLNRRLRLLRPEVVDDGFSRTEGALGEIGKVWAKKTDVRDTERVAASQHGASLTTRFLVRDTPLIRSLLSTDKAECEGVTYEIVGIQEADQARFPRGMEITTAAVRP